MEGRNALQCPLVDALSAELLRHDVLPADETPVAMLKPGNGKTHRAYLWSYCTTSFNPVRAVVFDFADSRVASTCASSSGCRATSATPAGMASSSPTTSAVMCCSKMCCAQPRLASGTK